MRFADLPPAVVEKIKAYRYDQIREKHEGPERWESFVRYGTPDFMDVDGFCVLFPLDAEQRPSITILRCIVGDGGKSLTVFLKDKTFSGNEAHEMFDAGYMAVCDKVPGENFYIAIVYHEWFIVENALPG